MRRRVVSCVLMGLPSIACAHDFSLSIVGPEDIGLNTTVFTLEVFGNASVGTHMLGGGFSLVSDNARIVSITWSPADWSILNTDGGYSGNGNYNQISFGQLLLPIPPFDVPAEGSELGSLIGTYTVNISDADMYTDFQLVAGDPFSLEVYDIDTGETFNNLGNNLQLGSARVYATPTPSTVSLFCFAGLVARRRRKKA